MNIQCPFCKETDFDLIGLKNHLLSGHCEDFNDVMSVEEEQAARQHFKESQATDAQQTLPAAGEAPLADGTLETSGSV